MSHRDLNRSSPLPGALPGATELPVVRIVGALLAMLALPVSSYFTGSSVGAYRMFTDVQRYRVQLAVRTSEGARRPLALAELAPHLGAAARRVILPARHFVFGETAAELLSTGRADLAHLACRLHPDARSVTVVVERKGLRGDRLARSEVSCGEPSTRR